MIWCRFSTRSNLTISVLKETVWPWPCDDLEMLGLLPTEHSPYLLDHNNRCTNSSDAMIQCQY